LTEWPNDRLIDQKRTMQTLPLRFAQ
jgi:hypothetical protein